MYQILIADDEEKVRDLLAKNISKLPLDVEVAAVAGDGREALELALKLKPDIVITDIAMPFLNGLELIRKMRENGIESKNLIISGYDEIAKGCFFKIWKCLKIWHRAAMRLCGKLF